MEFIRSLNRRVKKLGFFNIQLVKISNWFFALIVLKLIPEGCNTKKLQHNKNASNLRNCWTQVNNMYNMQGHGLAVKNTGAYFDRDGSR